MQIKFVKFFHNYLCNSNKLTILVYVLNCNIIPNIMQLLIKVCTNF